MARGLRLNEPGRAWAALAVALGAGALLGLLVPAPEWDWQPSKAAEPWRWWTAAFVHLNGLHLAGNLLGLALVAAVGMVGRLPQRAALAWALAWPLAHGVLLLRPEVTHYAGLSGVLHAGVAVAVTWLVLEGRRRRVAMAIGAGLVAKLLLEQPWGAPVTVSATLGIPVVPMAHAGGALVGLLLTLLLHRRDCAEEQR